LYDEFRPVKGVEVRGMSTFLQSILHLETPFNWLSLMGLAGIVFGAVTAAVTQIRKFADHALDVRFKRDLVERGLSVEEIERVLAAASRSGDCDKS
jgi:hypothetical protein